MAGFARLPRTDIPRRRVLTGSPRFPRVALYMAVFRAVPRVARTCSGMSHGSRATLATQALVLMIVAIGVAGASPTIGLAWAQHPVETQEGASAARLCRAFSSGWGLPSG